MRIEALSHDGRGVARVDGKAVFVTGALPGERVRLRFTARRRDFDLGQVEEVLEASPDRVAPRCPHFGVGGGCALQHLEPAAQIEAKQRTLADNLERIGRVEPRSFIPPLTASPWGYRRRARLSVRYVAKKGRVLVGFRERGGNYVCDTRECHVLAPAVGLEIDRLAATLSAMDARDRIPQIEVACGDQDAVLVVRHLDPLGAADRERLAAFARTSGLAVYLQPKGPDSIEPLDRTVELGYSLPADRVELSFSPIHFVQINAAINQELVALALEKLAPKPDSRVLDLYCGLGNFSLPLARRVTLVLGVEGDPALVELAGANARANGIDNARFEVADLAADDPAVSWGPGPFDRVLLDPPRSGAAETLAGIAALDPERVVYISCHPGTLARDAGTLVHEHGYTLTEAGVIDMFPHTAHVESIAVFTRGG